VAGVDHIRHTHDLQKNSFSKGQPQYGAEFADDLERLCALHDPSTIAAVIVEPVAGSAGVLVPPKGYLERLREICTKHGILLIFDEVITGFGRLGQPFGAQRLGVMPDLFTTAKGMTNGTVPMGAVFAKDSIYEAFMQGPEGIELFHGYTYSAHPLACAAGLGTLDTYEEEGLLTRAGSLEKHFEDGLHALRDAPHVIDIRNLGLMGAVELEARPGKPGARAYEAFLKVFEAGVLIRWTGDILAFSPPLIVEKAQIDRILDTVRATLKTIQ
jgi:beta-alanine--pyruvate transaminase